MGLIMKDRTGELCPFCKEGKLYPTGGRNIAEPSKMPKNGESRREYTEYECDNCHKKTKSLGLSLVSTISASTEFDIGKKED
jgi:hypothetical protein